MAEGQAYIGTSGWHYAHWQGVFYPPGLRPNSYLRFYAERFATVEINNAFYRLPSLEAVSAWRESVPEGFIFSLKASRYLTHMKKLRDPQEPLANVLSRVDALGAHRGPILFQLPPRWGFDAERLRAFLEALPTGYRFAFEFRDPSWFADRALTLLAKYGAAFCIYDLAGRTSPIAVTAGFIYIRLHGPVRAYAGSYGPAGLAPWVQRLLGWLAEGRDVYCYLDNDQTGYAVQDALTLREMAQQPA
ncbi:MAG: DUF72 domain-containing protein [Anaerolineae bacterium]